MKGALAAVCVGLLGASNAFVVPGPSKIISGRSTRASTSQVIVMGRGDTRTAKGKRMRHSYGNSRPQKQKAPVYFDGEIVKKAAPVARRWESIEYDEASIPKPKPAAAAAATATATDDVAEAVEEAVEEVAAAAADADAAAPVAAVEEAAVEEAVEAAPAADEAVEA